MTEKLVSAKDTARQFGINPRVLRQWAENGKVPAVSYGKRYLFFISHVKRYIDELSKSNLNNEHTPRQRQEKKRIITVNNPEAEEKLTKYLGG